MRIRKVALFGSLLLLATAIFPFSPWGRELMGRLRGEPIYQGRCASSWREEALSWQIVMTCGFNGFTDRVRIRSIPFWQRWLGYEAGPSLWSEKLPLLSGEPEVMQVRDGSKIGLGTLVALSPGSHQWVAGDRPVRSFVIFQSPAPSAVPPCCRGRGRTGNWSAACTRRRFGPWGPGRGRRPWRDERRGGWRRQ